ncbi:MAG: GDSL-type esterase/lipase family protein [Chitinophagaceae bacterium]
MNKSFTMKIKFIFVFLLVSSVIIAQETKPPFWNDIQSFKKQDSLHFPAPNQILLIGSSSFTMWKDVDDYFPGYAILNRGFGGSTLPDLIRYVKDIVFPYYPKQVLIYCGENDFASSDTVSVETVVNRTKQLFYLIRSKYKNVPIGYVSMKPSPSRAHLMKKYSEANKIIKEFLKKEKKTSFINVYDKMLKQDGTPMDDIFREDRLHMTAKGYAIWQKVLKPYLVK